MRRGKALKSRVLWDARQSRDVTSRVTSRYVARSTSHVSAVVVLRDTAWRTIAKTLSVFCKKWPRAERFQLQGNGKIFHIFHFFQKHGLRQNG